MTRLGVQFLLEAVYLVLAACVSMDWDCPMKWGLSIEQGEFLLHGEHQHLSISYALHYGVCMIGCIIDTVNVTTRASGREQYSVSEVVKVG